MRTIRLELRGARHRCFELVSYWASEADDLIRELRDSRPVIVHLAGHGCKTDGRPLAGHGGTPRDVVVDHASDPECGGGLALHARDGSIHIVSFELVRQIFELAGSSVRLVVVTACATEPLAGLLLAHVDCAISMDGPITDDTALAFSKGLYAAIGDGASVEQAFQAGCVAIRCAGLPGADRPRLKVRDGVDSSQIILAAVPRERRDSARRRPGPLPSRPGKRVAQRGTLQRRGKLAAQRASASGLRGKRSRGAR
jgi:hypothetical protein